MNNNQFKEGEHIVYQNGDRFEIGKIKRITKDGAFVYYSSGDTAAKTPFDCMHKLVNEYTINLTSLGGGCWISVEDCLPAFDQRVLAFVTNKDPERRFNRDGIYIAELKDKIPKHDPEGKKNFWGLPGYDSEWTVWAWSYFSEPCVTHWMPLPLPPTEV